MLGVRSIITDGTSAHRQMAVYERALDEGAEQPEAVREVVDFLIAETLNF